MAYIETDTGSGSGFMITNTGLCFTCNHVIKGSTEIYVGLINNEGKKTVYKANALIQNEDESTTSYIRKTTSGVIHISPLAEFDKYEPSEMFDEIDQRLLMLIAKQKDLESLNKSIYNNMIKDVRLDTEKEKITLVNKEGEDTGDGIQVLDLSTIVSKDLIGKDPDGNQDGVIDLDKVPSLQNLDLLLK